MTKEQEKQHCIDFLRGIINTEDDRIILVWEAKMILSILKEKDAEIKRLKSQNDEAYEENQRLKLKLDKKDKIIDEMAKYLASIDFDKQCLEISEPCLGCPKEDDLDGYMHCIKQYFEKEVEKESN